MIGGKPAIFVSCSEHFREQVADPIARVLELHGFHPVVVSEEAQPVGRKWEPEEKVDSFLLSCEAFIALLTPDERLEDGKFQCRHNIADEIGRARADPRLRRYMQILKSPEVELWSNINPTYDTLDVEDPRAAAELIVRQLRAWDLEPKVRPASDIHRASHGVGTPQSLSSHAEELLADLKLGEHDRAERRVYALLLKLNREQTDNLVGELLDLATATEGHTTQLLACSLIEAIDRLDPSLIQPSTVERLTRSDSFSLRSCAAVLLWQWAETDPGKVPVSLLGRLARPTEEDWYVQAPAMAASKLMLLHRRAAEQIFATLAQSDDPETRYAAVSALLDVVEMDKLAVPVRLATALADDAEQSVATKGAELKQALAGIAEEARGRRFRGFGL